jgi:hypothetical protein
MGRVREILRLKYEGANDRQIARSLSLARSTVELTLVPDEQRRHTPPSGRALATPPGGGRLQIGMVEIKSESVADFIPESLADFPRNMHPLRRTLAFLHADRRHFWAPIGTLDRD